MSISEKLKKPLRRRRESGRYEHAPPGSSPGMIRVPDDALKPKIHYFRYTESEFEESDLNGVDEIRAKLNSTNEGVFWFDIHGFGDKLFLEKLADCFQLHRLQMEDVVNVYQRPKAEDSNAYLFFVSRVIQEKAQGLVNDQLSLFLGKNFVISLQDKYEDILDPVRDRIRRGKGYIRTNGADYLVYALMDTALDNYYPILEHIGERLDDLEDELISNPSRFALNKVLQIKRELIVLRRSIWSERDKINDILRSAFPQVKENTKLFLRDSYDHCIQILDLVESYKEVTASLMDVYHSSVSYRMNQIMKVLTIISTIFIPLTFIVGLYGMNFAHIDPQSGKVLTYNMPELYSPYGYVVVCAVMLLIVVGQIYFFYKKGWLTKN